MQKVDCILLVDDDEITNTLHQFLLKKMNIANELLVAINGKRALDIIINRHENNLKSPDLIFLDINMPVMNGFEFLKAYEQLDILEENHVITVMLTTSINPKDIENAKHPFISSFLNKPLTSEKVNDVLVKYFKK